MFFKNKTRYIQEMNVNYFFRVTCLLFLFAATQGYAQTAQTATVRERLQIALDSLQKANNFPGASFAALLPDGEEIRIVTGFADSASRAKMKPGHRMLSGSIGKTFFAAAVVSLAEQGVFGLDDPISKYLSDEPWFNRLPNAGSVTLRMLMNHTSGIEEYYELGDFMQRLKADPYRQWKPVELFSYIFDRKPLFPAGSAWGYSDTNYLILGYIVEKTTGKKMYDLAHRYALKPYRLSLTEPSLKVTFKDLATGYSRAGNPFPFYGAMVKDGKLVFNPAFEWTGGGFVSNPADLADWAKGLYHLKGVSAGTRREMQAGVKAQTGRDHLYGLGMQIRPWGNGLSYGHSGWFPGYVSDCLYDPASGTALAIQFNTDDGRLLKMATYSYLQLLNKIIAQ
ncbi:MAG TPA: serine hydrolase domain-containing protein [Sphingobacteriaceae bacterium]